MEQLPAPEASALGQLDRRLAQRVFIGIGLLGAVAIAGPLLSYRSDVAEVHRVFHARVSREAHVYAITLDDHFRVLQSELERLAARPEVNLLDNTMSPEETLLGSTYHNSALFSAVALLDARGSTLWSEPGCAVPVGASFSDQPWFQEGIAYRRPVTSLLAGYPHVAVVAVPVLRRERTTGVVMGLVDPAKKQLPGARPEGEQMDLVVSDGQGRVLLPAGPPNWARTPSYPGLLETLLRSGVGQTVRLGGSEHYAAATVLPTTGFRLLLAADESAVIAPIRRRFLFQLFFIAVLQGLTVLLFAIFLRRTYQTFMRMERHALQQEKMAALGSAASLIAHEVKNSLNGLKAATALVTSGADPALPARTMGGQIDRLAHLASSLLQFGKPASAQLVCADLSQIVKDAVESLRQLPESEDVAVEVVAGARAPVRCDPLLLTTALDNLVRNAVEAGAVAKDLGRIGSPRVQVSVARRDALIEVHVEDNAGGPPGDFEERIFQPFVTSKPKGIGLGLSMARQAIEQQGGSLRFERTNAGSRFTVSIAAEEAR